MFIDVTMEYVLKLLFVLIKDLSSKIILGNPFMALLYPFLTTYEGIKTNVLGHFKFILPPIPKEIYSLDNISIIKEIDKKTFVILKVRNNI